MDLLLFMVPSAGWARWAFSASRCKPIAVAGLVVPGPLTKGLDLLVPSKPLPGALHLLHLQLLTSSLYISATAWADAGRLLIWAAATVYTVHCTLYLCCVWAQYSPPPPPPVPLGQDGGDLLLAASFTVTHQGSASSQIQASIVFETGFW